MAPELRELLGQDILMTTHWLPIKEGHGKEISQIAPNPQNDEHPYRSSHVNDGGLSPVAAGLDDMIMGNLSSIPHDLEVSTGIAEEEINHPFSPGFPVQSIELHELVDEVSQGTQLGFANSSKFINSSFII